MSDQALKKILLIEDDPEILELYRMPFETSDLFDIVTETGGRDGLAKAIAFMPDLILLDIKMSHMDGIEVLKQLKSSNHTSNIIVIMLSNINDLATINKTKELGALDFWNKGILTPKQVFEKVKEVLGVKS